MNLHATIPAMPLGILLLPGEQIPLHIFEPRYRQLFQEAESERFRIGFPFPSSERGDSFVSICSLMDVAQRYPGGESDVVIVAEQVAPLVAIRPTMKGKPYPAVVHEPELPEMGTQAASSELKAAFGQYVQFKFEKEVEPAVLAGFEVCDIAASVTMSPQEKVRYLRMPNDDARDHHLLKVVQYLLLLYRQEVRSEGGIILN